jgi:hypothetical protein
VKMYSQEMLFGEEFADEIHEVWASWAGYMLMDVGIQNEDGSITIPKSSVERWNRQMTTPYSELSEKEKNSDRQIARNLIKRMVDGKRR